METDHYLIDTQQIQTIHDFTGNRLKYERLFVEIGFGPDRFFIDQAIIHPADLYVGIEIRHKRVLKALKKIRDHNLCNAFIIWGEAYYTISSFFHDSSLQGVYINFPDPYHKKRHMKRRLITIDFLNALAKKLAGNGFCMIITDNVPYMEYILEIFDQFNEETDRRLDFKKQDGMPEGYPMTEFALRDSKGKGPIQHIYARRNY